VVARFSDVNGPRGGRDKRCLLEVILRQGAPVLIDSTSSDLSACLDWAADRAGQSIGRELERTRATSRASWAELAARPASRFVEELVFTR
jgi:hypothetical protein